jgi:predicted RNA binding protein YcfA (HicA-like mRNA interferase family)
MKVRDVLRMIEQDGWRFHSQKGSHRQFVHALKPGRVTIPGHPADEVPRGTFSKILKQAGLKP